MASMAVQTSAPARRAGKARRAQEGRARRRRADGVPKAQAATEEAAEAQQEGQPEQGRSPKEAKAVKSRVRMSPLKVRKVLNTIRGRDYEECLMKLEFMRYRACEPILKTLISAAANAKHNYGMNKAKLYVSECYANEGTFLKRAEPRALGQAFRYRKKQTHITIRVRERSD